MRFLPTKNEQRWLIDRLADLLTRLGSERFIAVPIIEPTPQFFPDRWSFSHEGLDRLVRRLMQYAGLGELDVEITTFVETQPWERPHRGRQGRSTAGLFMGINQGCCLFAFSEETPADPEFMAGVMCHEVAHAFRSHWRLSEDTTSDEEEWLTDLTACYLGFGILAANNSYRCRTAALTESTGYLPPQAFAFLLGAQMVAQSLSSEERTRLLKYLEPNQASFTKAAVTALLKQRAAIMRRFGLQPGSTGGPMKGLEEILRPLPEYVEPVLPADSPEAMETCRFNAGRPVFAVQKSRASVYTAVGFVLGLVAGALITGLSGQPVAMAVLLVIGSGAGAYYGWHQRYEVCSDRACEAVLEPGMSECPHCGGHIAGSIRHADDRLEAEEDYYRKMDEESEEAQKRVPPPGSE